MKSKTWVAVVVIAVAAALALPVANLVSTREVDPALLAQVEDPTGRQMVQIYAEKCTDCHSGRGVMPFYASWPVAKQLIQKDMEQARAVFDMDREMYGPGVGVSEAALAKIQRETDHGAMPPAAYLLLHWKARFSGGDAAKQAAWARSVRAAKDGDSDPANPVYDLPVYPLRRPQGLDARKVALGEAMYHDVRLSGDDTISCSSCHDLRKGGTDQARVSTGVGGQKGGINAPTTFNAVYHLSQFWNGRAADLAAQADGPPNNPIEMATNWPQVLGKLQQDAAVVAAFQDAYGGLSAAAVKDAIATYEATLVTPGDPLDRFLLGDTTALSPAQLDGWHVFRARGCDTCHVGPALGGTSYEKMGLHGDYMSDRGSPTDADLGRFAVTGDEHDKAHFKVPTLRNVALTFPYYHDGSVDTLAQAVQKMGHYQRGRELTEAEVASIVALLEALVGELPAPPPAGAPTPA